MYYNSSYLILYINLILYILCFYYILQSYIINLLILINIRINNIYIINIRLIIGKLHIIIFSKFLNPILQLPSIKLIQINNLRKLHLNTINQIHLIIILIYSYPKKQLLIILNQTKSTLFMIYTLN